MAAKYLHWAYLALCLQLVTTSLAGRQRNYTKPDYEVYHTKDGIFDEVRSIVEGCPSIMSLEERTMADGEYSTTMTIVTVEPGGLTEDHSKKMRMLVDFGEHGRELISPEISLHLLKVLCDSSQLPALASEYKLPMADITALLSRTVLKIIPMENVRGRERVEAGQLCERKNGRDVDPNRNWDLHWGFKEKDYDPREEYPGEAPFSEPEAGLLKQLALEFKPDAWVNVHSGMEAMFMPYDHKAVIPEGEAAQITLAMLHSLNEEICGNRCAVGSGGKSVGYLAHGTATDYMYEVLKIPVTTTWEVYGDFEASYYDCFRMFNPLNKAGVESVVKAWTAAVFGLMVKLPQHPEVTLHDEMAGKLTPISSKYSKKAARVEVGTADLKQINSTSADGGSSDDKSSSSSEVPNPTDHQQQQQKAVAVEATSPSTDSSQQQKQQQEEKQPVPRDTVPVRTAEVPKPSLPSTEHVPEEITLLTPGDATLDRTPTLTTSQAGKDTVDSSRNTVLRGGRKEAIGGASIVRRSVSGVPERGGATSALTLGLLLGVVVVASAMYSKPKLRYEVYKMLRRRREDIPL